MESNFASGIPGIEFYPIVALLLFFGFYATLLAWFFLHDRSRLKAYALAPFDDDSELEARTRMNHPLTSTI